MGIVRENEVCDPKNISIEDGKIADQEQLVCQISIINGKKEEGEIKKVAKFANAKKGDIILSPAGDTVIGHMLKASIPPMKYSHCGIMTNNYEEITHSTASEERIGYDDYVEKPIGIRPDILKYSWPGIVTQTVTAAVIGETWEDPENKNFSINSFKEHEISVESNGILEAVHPLVVCPDPTLETREIRLKLHEVAEYARRLGVTVRREGQFKGRPDGDLQSHYRFYCYSDPTIGDSHVEDNVGWAKGTFPSVCSSFLWKVLRECNVYMGSSNGIMDGLTKYSAENRVRIAQYMHNYLSENISSKLTDIQILTGIQKRIASQICNLFAYDNPDTGGLEGSFDSSLIRDAYAVSPDDILSWKSPKENGLYGFANPLQYIEPRPETYYISRWKKIVTRGILKGTITAKGHGPVSGVVVYLNSSGYGPSNYSSSPSDDHGNYVIERVPLGSYGIWTDHKIIDSLSYYSEEYVDVDSDIVTYDITMMPPSIRNRLVKIAYTFFGWDDEIIGKETLKKEDEVTVDLNPDRPNAWEHDFRWGGEMHVRIRISLTLNDNNSVHAIAEGWLVEGTDEDPENEGISDPDDYVKVKEVDIPAWEEGGEITGISIHLDSGDNDFADFTGFIINKRNIV